MATTKGLGQLSSTNRAHWSYRCPNHNRGGRRAYVLPAGSPPRDRAAQASQLVPSTTFPLALPTITGAAAASNTQVVEPLYAPLWSRRAALLSLSICAGGLVPGLCGRGALATTLAEPSLPHPLRSLSWSVPSELTVLNELDGALKVYWLNYDGDAELFGSLSPGSVFTVRTFESHAWRFVDGTSGAIVAEHVMAAGQQVVRLASSTAAAAAAAAGLTSGRSTTSSYNYTTASGDAARQPLTPRGSGTSGGAAATSEAAAAASEGQVPTVATRTAAAGGGGGGLQVAAFEGFDGLGNGEQHYCLAQLREVKIYPGGGNVLLLLPGGAAVAAAAAASTPLELALAGPEALSLVSATGSLEQRRPSTLLTWVRSMMASGVELRRVCVTRLVDGVYYCRIVLSRPDSTLCSVDATPGDALSLALQLGRPIYVAKEVVRVHQCVADVYARRRRAIEAAAASGFLDEAAEAEVNREAQDALDSINREIPSAPRPVRAVGMDLRLDA